MMKKSVLWLVFISFSVLGQMKENPNIIVVLADDISAREFPIYKSDTWSKPEGGDTQDKKYRAFTPVLDKMAEEGIYFKSAWADVVCSPSRAMMMTGRYAHLHKWWGNHSLGQYTSKEGKMEVIPFYETSPLEIGHVAQKAGYATMWSGKTQMRSGDLGLHGFDEGVFTPGESSLKMKNPYSDFVIEVQKLNGKRMDVNLDTGLKAENTWAQPSWYFKPYVLLMNHPSTSEKYEWWPNTKASKKNYGAHTYGPDIELEFIFDFMERKVEAKKPFFVYHTTHLGHNAFDFLHPTTKLKWPGTPKLKWKKNKYIRTTPKVTGDKGVYDTHGTITDLGMHHHVNYLDYQMWLYLKKLKKLDVLDNTIIIFCADNGSGYYGKNSPVSQKGTHVPFIVYGPGLKFTKKGAQDALVSLADVLPTIAEIGDFKFPKDYEVNGESLVPYLTTKQLQHRAYLYAYQANLQLIRGEHLLKDGNNNWYDVSEIPSDLISFPKITDWNQVSRELRAEKDRLVRILPTFDKFDSAQHGELSDKHKKILDDAEKLKLEKKRAKKNKYLKGKKNNNSNK